MRRLDRYLLRQYAMPAVYCLLGFYMLFIVYSLFKDLPRFIEADTPPGLAARYYACQVDYVVRYIVPASLFFAALYTLWRLARGNELTAMRASGIGLHRTMLPFLWVGAAMSVLSLVLNETVTPAAKEWASAFLKNNFRPAPPPGLRLCKFYSSATHREWTIQKFDPRRPSLLIGVEVEQERADATRREIVSAPRAEWLDGQWWFYNARVQQFDENEDPLANPVRLGGWYSVREMRNFTERPSDFLSQTKEWEFLTTPQMIRYVQIQPQMSGELPRKLFHIHRRMALPWACLVVTLFGIPTGARGSRRSALAGMFAAMALFAGFYAVTQIGTYLGMRGLTWPWMGAWFANITFGLAGAWLSIEVR